MELAEYSSVEVSEGLGRVSEVALSVVEVVNWLEIWLELCIKLCVELSSNVWVELCVELGVGI